MIKISALNIRATFKGLAADLGKEAKQQADKINEKILSEIKEETPIDTGLARRSWEIRSKGLVTEIVNTTDYIQYLNQGSSKQAPKYFIEKVALKYGQPLGSIVEIQKESQ